MRQALYLKQQKKMKMSYKAAWDDIQNINQHSPTIVVQTATGGKNGGGSKISDYGKELIETFDLLQGFIHNLEDNLKNFENLTDLRENIQTLQKKLS